MQALETHLRLFDLGVAGNELRGIWEASCSSFGRSGRIAFGAVSDWGERIVEGLGRVAEPQLVGGREEQGGASRLQVFILAMRYV